MDDKLFYVESPDGRVLGPMTMMNILEGIAAGAILDTARICEVGRQEWVDLSEVAYARDDEAAEAPAAPAEAPVPESRVADVPAVDSPAEAPTAEETPSWEETAPSAEPAMELSSATDSFLPSEEPEPVDPIDPNGTVVTTPDSSIAHATTPEAGDVAPPAPAEVPAVVEAQPEFEAPQAALPLSAFPADVPAGAEDFALHMEGANDEVIVEETMEAPADEKRERPKWLLPAAVAVAVPVVAGIYLMASGQNPLAGDDAAEEVAQATPTKAVVQAEPTVAEQAWRRLSEGDAEAALPLFEQAVAELPEDAKTHHGWGLAALQLQKPKKAEKALSQALALDETQVPVRTDLGRAQLLAGKADAAIATAKDVLKRDETYQPAKLLRGEAELAAGRTEAAVTTLTEYVGLRPNDHEVRRTLARALAGTGRLEPAVDEMTRYLEFDPTDLDAQRERLDWLRAGGRLTEAAQIYGQLANANPQNANLQFFAGLAQAQTSDGAAFFERALSIDPNHAEAKTSLRSARAELARAEKAAAPKPEPTVAVTAPAPAATNTEAAAPTPTPTPTEVATPEPAAPKTPLATQLANVREAMRAGALTRARNAYDAAREEYSNDPAAQPSLKLMAGVLDFEEGLFADALRHFEALDPNASFAAAGYGPGALQNWIARVQLVRGDVRSAIGTLDSVGLEDPNEYAAARLWEGVALKVLGMNELAERTWQRIGPDVGAAVGQDGFGAVKSAELLAGSISAKDYRTAVGKIAPYENDMHFFLGFMARQGDELEVARGHYRKVLESSRGHDFPYHLAQAEVAGEGLSGEWPADSAETAE